jgi:hypothetical protein
MEKLYFLPQWYLENKKAKRKKIMKIFVSTLIIIDLILVECLFININRKKVLEDELNQKTTFQKNEKLQKNKVQVKNNRTLDTFLTLNKDIQENIYFESLYIEGKKVELSLNSEKSNYISFIKKIESINKFTIKQASFSNDGLADKIKINMELK